MEKTENLADVCSVAQTPTIAAIDADCIICMLVDGLATGEAVTANVLAASAEKAIVINMGSADPQTDRELAALAASWNRPYLDAPVSGGVSGAKDGTLAILVGGDQKAYDRAATVFSCLGHPTLLGPVGAGQVAKLAN